MSARPAEMMSVAEASFVLEGWAQGLVGADRGQVLLVDLSDDTGSMLSLPDHLPGIVVGVGTPGRSEVLGGVDVALTAEPEASRPWVTVSDPTETVEEIAAMVEASPVAAATYAQVLRAGAGLSVTLGLLLESLAYSTLQGGREYRAWLASRAPVTSSAGTDAVLVSRSGDEVSIVLNRPDVHNAYNAAMREQLTDALAIAASDPTVKKVALSGAGASFCSGGDLTEFGTAPDPASAHLIRFGRSPARLLAGLSARVSARVHGFCVGSGIELPAFAGRIEAHPDTIFQLPELALGLIPGAGGTVSLPRRIGRHRTAWLGLTGRRIGTRVALEWGLVDAVSPG
jgi:hypothetical protein